MSQPFRRGPGGPAVQPEYVPRARGIGSRGDGSGVVPLTGEENILPGWPDLLWPLPGHQPAAMPLWVQRIVQARTRLGHLSMLSASHASRSPDGQGCA